MPTTGGINRPAFLKSDSLAIWKKVEMEGGAGPQESYSISKVQQPYEDPKQKTIESLSMGKQRTCWLYVKVWSEGGRLTSAMLPCTQSQKQKEAALATTLKLTLNQTPNSKTWRKKQWVKFTPCLDQLVQ